MDEEGRSVVDVQADGVPRPGLGDHEVGDVRVVEPDSGVGGDARQLFGHTDRGPLEQRSGEFHDVDPGRPQLQQSRGGVAQAQAPDQHPFRPRTHGVRKCDLGGHLLAVHGEDSVDDQFDGVIPAAQHHQTVFCLGV